MESYPKAAMERGMEIQEVILRAVAQRITWWQAAEIIGVSDRTMRRWKERYEEHGYDGLYDRRLGKPSPQRIALATVEEVLALYQEKYFDFNVQHFHEKLREEHHIRLSYTWVKQAPQGAGLVKKTGRRGEHRRRRPLVGMLLHIDGSRHRWFQDQRWYDLLTPMVCQRLWKRRAAGNRGKVQNQDFPTVPTALGNPANCAGFPLSHSHDDDCFS